jgi:signal transduction histidine kinase
MLALAVSHRATGGEPVTLEPPARLTTARQVHALSAEQARKGLPVDLRATVTYADHPDRCGTLFISDDTAGLYIVAPKLSHPPQFGAAVRIIGVTGPGDFAPVVIASEVTPTFTSNAPIAHPVSFDDLASGSEDCEFVEFRGIVRAAGLNTHTGFAEMRLAGGGGQLRVQVAGMQKETNYDRFVDAKVLVRGAVGGIFNQKRQLVAAKLFVPSPSQITIEEQPPETPFDIPTRHVKSLLQFMSGSSHGHRVKVRGVVTYAQLPQTLFIRDETQGVEIRAQASPPLKLGDEAEVVGFPAVGEWTPLLQDAIVRRIGTAAPLAPAQVTAREALQGNFDSELVRLQARLVEYVPRSDMEVLVLQSQETFFNALLQPGQPQLLSHFQKGSRLQLTGVCQVQVAGPDKARQSFRLLLRAPSDVLVLAGPPFWTMPHFLWTLSLVSAILLLVSAWVVVLRRRVQAQTEVIREKIRLEAVNEERGRLARDIHDDLGSSLTRIMMLGERAAEELGHDDEAGMHVRKIVSSARDTVQSLDEIVWAVNPDNDTLDGLVGYINQYACQFFESTSVRCRLEMPTELPSRSLPADVRHNLFLVVREAFNNVLKHSHASEAQVRIAFRQDEVQVVVADNGVGFQIKGEPNGKRGHGLTNMRQRMEAMGGHLHIASGANKGTTVTFTLHLNGKKAG